MPQGACAVCPPARDAYADTVQLTVPKSFLFALLALAIIVCPARASAQSAGAALDGPSVIIREPAPAMLEQRYHFEPPLSLLQAPFGLRRGPEPFRVFGFSEREALAQSADPDGEAFSKLHAQGDMANRWSHAAIAKSAAGVLQQAGLKPWAASLLGAAILLPKEFGIDRRPSRSDLVIADFPLFSFGRRERAHSAASLSLFGDGALFVSLEARF